jgi:hypothetical protein
MSKSPWLLPRARPLVLLLWVGAQCVPASSVHPLTPSPFHTGACLNDVIALIETSPSQYPNMCLTYEEDAPLEEEIKIELREVGIILYFEPYGQRLRAIQVYSFDRLELTYEGVNVRYVSVSLDIPGQDADGTLSNHV